MERLFYIFYLHFFISQVLLRPLHHLHSIKAALIEVQRDNGAFLVLLFEMSAAYDTTGLLLLETLSSHGIQDATYCGFSFHPTAAAPQLPFLVPSISDL